MKIALNLDVFLFENKADAMQVLKDLPDELRTVELHAIRVLEQWDKQEKANQSRLSKIYSAFQFRKC